MYRYIFLWLLIPCAFPLTHSVILRYIWTVNWAFVPEYIFLDRRFHACLLSVHLVLLLVFLTRWLKRSGTSWRDVLTTRNISANEIVLVLFGCNLVGVAFARSLHYQFYVWYFHSLPWLLWNTGLPVVLR